MTDRELLERAARAAGIPIIGWTDGDKLAVTEPEGFWNPLRRDGDALRLAVTLRMRLQVDDYGAAARIGDNGRWCGCEAHLHGGIEPATRRAIVRAAAACEPSSPSR